jgi:dienelactone hydrolase
MWTIRRLHVTFLLMTVWCTLSTARSVSAQTRETVTIRGHSQLLHLYGVRGGTPFIVSSGDGGWIHLGPHVAEVLAANGGFVIGFDVKTYLESFTGQGTLRVEDVPGDYQVLVDFAAKGSTTKPLLIGVSEGAGLSVLAAVDPRVKASVTGVIGLGLPDRTELAWRWRDSIIYLTHGAPREPTFSTAAIVGQLAPLPLAAIHSTHDEFVPAEEVREILDRADNPKRLWLIEAANHRFSDRLAEFDRRLLEAIDWTAAQSPFQ